MRRAVRAALTLIALEPDEWEYEPNEPYYVREALRSYLTHRKALTSGSYVTYVTRAAITAIVTDAT